MISTPIRRTYSDFRGVDFANDPSLVLLSRSPDALNVWKNYKDTQGSCIESRPGYKLLHKYFSKIYGIYFYNNKALIHVSNSLYLWDNFPETPSPHWGELLSAGMNTAKSSFVIFNENLYIVDGLTYFVYDGTTFKDVSQIKMNPVYFPTGNPFEKGYYELYVIEGEPVQYIRSADTTVDNEKYYYELEAEPYVPTTTISRSPSGRRRTLSRCKCINSKKEKYFCRRWNFNGILFRYTGNRFCN